MARARITVDGEKGLLTSLLVFCAKNPEETRMPLEATLWVYNSVSWASRTGPDLYILVIHISTWQRDLKTWGATGGIWKPEMV